jgi:hypothetical protein
MQDFSQELQDDLPVLIYQLDRKEDKESFRAEAIRIMALFKQHQENHAVQKVVMPIELGAGNYFPKTTIDASNGNIVIKSIVHFDVVIYEKLYFVELDEMTEHQLQVTFTSTVNSFLKAVEDSVNTYHYVMALPV